MPKYKVDINYRELIYFFRNKGIVTINNRLKNIFL